MPIVPDVPTPPPRRRKIGKPVFEAVPDAPLVQAQSIADLNPDRLLQPYDGPRTTSNEFRDRWTVLYDIDPSLAMDHALDTLSRLLMAKMTLDQIAKTMNVNADTVLQWKHKLKSRLKANMKKIDIHVMIGKMVEEDEELRAQGWRDIQAAQKVETVREDIGNGQFRERQIVVVDWKRRAKGAELVLKAKASMLRTLDQTGALDTAPMRSSIEVGEDGESHVNALKGLAESFLQGNYKRGPMPDEIDDGGD